MKDIMKNILGTLFTIVAVVGCGGGGGGSGGTSIAGIDRIGISAGPVTGFGSIFVSDDRFGTDIAEFNVDDDSTSSSETDLEIGDFVIVSFDPANPTNALTVFSDDLVEGPVSTVNPATNTIVVAGQTVIVDTDTVFDDSINPASIEGISPADFIEVSGQFDANGDIRASRIEPGMGETEVHGEINGLDTGAMTFMINALNVSYASAVIDDNISGGTLANGQFVEVKGVMSGATLNATKVEQSGIGVGADDGIDLGDFDEIEIEIEGFITRFASATDFDVSNFPVTTNASTEFIGGTAGDLGQNVKIEVEGALNASNVLVATKVDIRRANAVRVSAQVDSVDSDNNEFTVLGVTVRVDNETRLEDKSSAEEDPLLLTQLVAGNYVEVRGGTDAGGGADIIASEVRRDDLPNGPGEDTELRGFAENPITATSFTILSVTIETDGGTVFRDAGGNPFNNASDFFNALDQGDAVDVNGTEISQKTMVADEVQFEN